MSQAFLNALASKSTYKAPTHEDNPSYTKLHVYDAFGNEKYEIYPRKVTDGTLVDDAKHLARSLVPPREKVEFEADRVDLTTDEHIIKCYHLTTFTVDRLDENPVKEKTETPTPVNPEWELHKQRVDYLLSLGYSFGDLCVVAVAHLYSAHKDDPEMPVHTVGVN